MQKKTVRNWNILVVLILLVIVVTGIIYFIKKDNNELRTVKSAKELERIYQGDRIGGAKEVFIRAIGMPFSLVYNFTLGNDIGYDYPYMDNMNSSGPWDIRASSTMKGESIVGSLSSATNSTTSSKDYSTTNIQVENVDEADITKTDGDYIYSISGDDVVITNVKNPKDIKVAAKISSDGSIPEDLILSDNKLVVIATNSTSNFYYNTSSRSNTIVKSYDINDKENPKLVKHYTLYEPYYTSRCINNKLYVISSGNLREENDDIVTYYTEDGKQKEIGFDHMQYLKEVETRKQTLISMFDLNDVEKEVKINSYLIDISNAYVSENNIYLLDQEYEDRDAPKISSLFGLFGAIGPFFQHYVIPSYYINSSYGEYTKIYKFNILEDGTIKYDGKTKTEGKTINQYSVDEYDGNLRLALYGKNGSRVVIFDKNLKEIGRTADLAKGEKMYSSRFMGNKAYLVTYRTVDPLYVIDLSNVTEPKVLGELKIPGYSTYLHPYNENHLIGIGMETEEIVNRDSSGRVLSTTARIVGMKMALFDVTDVNNPIQMSNVVIGDSRTTSAILTNPKALLFSKEKELLAIPVNNYAEDFSIKNSSDTYSSMINSYRNYEKSYLSEGYAVYKINLADGIKLKGMITHNGADLYTGYNYRENSKLLRGLYIDENLYTVSENQVKVNNLDTLKLVDEIDLKVRKQTTSTTNRTNSSNTIQKVITNEMDN